MHYMVMTADSFPSRVLRLNNNEYSSKYLSANGLVLLIAALHDGNLFCTKYKYTSLKNGLFRNPVWISITGEIACSF